MASENLKLWDRWRTPNPDFTKRLKYGAKLTTTDAQYLIQCATEEWGPYGSTWGLKNCKIGYVTLEESEAVEGGATVRRRSKPVEIYIECEFYYPGGSFEISNDHPYKPGDECRKKLETNTLCKALSKVGFAADVYLGRFDDDKYIAEARARSASSGAPKQAWKPKPPQPPQRGGGGGFASNAR